MTSQQIIKRNQTPIHIMTGLFMPWYSFLLLLFPWLSWGLFLATGIHLDNVTGLEARSKFFGARSTLGVVGTSWGGREGIKGPSWTFCISIPIGMASIAYMTSPSLFSPLSPFGWFCVSIFVGTASISCMISPSCYTSLSSVSSSFYIK